MVKKNLSRMLSFLFLFSGLLFGSLSAYAYEIPDNSYSIQLVDRNIGQIEIAVPFNYAKYISFDGTNLVNQYSGNITCYANSITAGTSTEYTIRFQPFRTPDYRTSNYNQYVELDIIEILHCNLPNINDSDFTIFSQNTLVNMITLLIAGSLIVLLLKKR